MRRLRRLSRFLPLVLIFLFTAGVEDFCEEERARERAEEDRSWSDLFRMMDARRAAAVRLAGEDVVPIVGDSGGAVDEIMSRIRPGASASGARAPGSPSSFVATLDYSSRIFVTDETDPWVPIDLAPFFPSGGSIYALAIVGSQVILGTDQGIAWVNARDGSYGHFTGAPTSFTVSLVDNGKGGLLAGVYYGTSDGTPSVFLCDPGTHACTLSNAGTTSDQYGYPFGDFAVVSGTSGSTVVGATYYGGGVYRSNDGGRSWTPCRSGLPATLSARRLFASGGTLLLGADGNAAGLYVSTNLGDSWTKAAGLPAGSVLGIGGNASALYAGVTPFAAGTPAAVYKSTDGGASWHPTGAGITASRINGVAVASLGVYALTNGGTFQSTDGGATWAPFNRGKDNATILSLLAANGTVFAGTQANLSGVQRSSDGGQTWTPGDATIANRSVASLAALGSTLVGVGPGGNFRSTDGGATWSATGPKPFGTVVSDGQALYAAYPLSGPSAVAVYRSADGVTWSPATAGLPAGKGATALAVSGGTVYAAVGPAVYSSSNGGSSWTAGGTVFPADTTYSISCLAVVNGSLYAGLTGFGANPATYGFYKSTNGGAGWAPIQTGLPQSSYAYALVGIGSTLYAGLQGGLFQSSDGGATWSPFATFLENVAVNALAADGNRLWVGTTGRGLQVYTVPVTVGRIVPIVLDVASGSARYTTELALTNRGATAATVTLAYTASLGSGSGTVTDAVAAGEQREIPDVIAYLRAKGLAIPSAGSEGGTLRVSFQGLADPDVVAVTARTTTSTAAPQPAGRAGLAYDGAGAGAIAVPGLTIYGLRSSATDRSNVAVFSMSADPVTVDVTAVSGDGDGRSFAVATGEVIPPWGWKQYNGVLATAGMTNGWVTVRQTSTLGAFSAYGVVNDQGTNDGSYVSPSFGDTMFPYVNVPVLVETSAFVSELTLANSGPTPATLTLSYRESLSPASGAGGTMTLTLPARTQRIIPRALAFLRQNGVAVGPAGGSYAGSLHVGVSGAHVRDFFAGARTASPSPGGGQFGLFTPAFSAGTEAVGEAWVYGLRADAATRSNVAVVNTGASGFAGPITLQLQAYDGDAGGAARGAPQSITLAPGQWFQASGFLGAQGVTNGWVKVTRTAGASPWIAYGVINDGGGPGQGTGDGAYVPMVW